MILCKCTQKFRDKSGRIIGYRLIDTKGNQIDITSAQLKNYLVLGQLNITNLKLTSDNRLINIEERNDKQNIKQDNSVCSEDIIIELPKLYKIKKDLKASSWTATEEENAFGWENTDKKYTKGSVLQLVAEDENNIYLCSYNNINPINDNGEANKNVVKINRKHIYKTVLPIKDVITISRKLKLKKTLVLNLYNVADMYEGTELLDVIKELIDSFGSDLIKVDFSKYKTDLDSYTTTFVKIPKETEIMVESYSTIKVKSYNNKFILLDIDNINYGFTNACDITNLLDLIGVDKSWIKTDNC